MNQSKQPPQVSRYPRPLNGLTCREALVAAGGDEHAMHSALDFNRLTALLTCSCGARFLVGAHVAERCSTTMPELVGMLGKRMPPPIAAAA